MRNLQESYLFHDKKIYALVASALHVTCVLSVFFHSFLTQSHACSGQEGPGAELQQTEGTKAPRHCMDTVLVRSLAVGISWCEGTALISAAELWHSSPLPPQRRDIQTLPASCPGKIHWGGTRSEAASRWRHKTVSVVRKEKGLLSALRAHN